MITVNKRRVFEQMFGAQLEEWEGILENDKEKVAWTAAASCDAVEREGTLRVHTDAFRKKLDELKHSPDNAWEDLKVQADEAWAAVKSRIPAKKGR